MEPPFQILKSSSYQNADFFDTGTNMAIDNEDEVEQVAASVNLSELAHLKNLVTFLQEVTPFPETPRFIQKSVSLEKKWERKLPIT